MTARVIGVDLGGTQIRSVLATLDGEVHARDVRLTLADEGPAAVIERIVTSVATVAEVAAGDGGDRVAAIGIGAPGPTDPHRGVLLMGPNLPGWSHVNLRDMLFVPFGVPVYVGNDANLAGLAEYRFGAGRGVDHMVYITQSTGIGGGIIVNRKMLVGAQGLAAEIGHMTIDLSQDAPALAVVGTLEGLAAGPDIAARAQRRLRAGAASLARELAGGSIEEVGARHLCEAAALGDEFALEQFRETGVYMGVGITNLCHIFNPQRIVIGGSVWLNCSKFMVDAVWATIRKRAQSPEYWQWLEIVPAALGDDVGLLGAVALAVGELNKGT
ncbi:MAG: ROK family protein [Caldilineaceae bacterium]